MPHDESMKFLLLREKDEYLNKRPFEKFEEGQISIINELPENNAPSNIGKLAAVGRNVIMQSIVDSLSYNNPTVTRLVHIYGAGGVGKSYIAKHAAKYLFERRNFDEGWVHIELKSKYTMGENLGSLICNALGMQTATKNELCNYINKCRLLIIIDKSSKIELDQNLLNTTLEFFLECTEVPKFIVITECKDDIFSQDKLLQFEIGELDARNAANLLLM